MPIVEIETLKQKLDAARVKLWDAIQPLSPEEMSRPRAGAWSTKDILAHLAFAEALNVKFAKLMLTQEHPVQLEAMAQDYPDYAGPFSLDGFNAYMMEKLRAQSLDETLAALRETRAATLAWMDTLAPEQLERGGQHAAWGDATVRGMLKVIALHERMHTQDIKKEHGSCEPRS